MEILVNLIIVLYLVIAVIQLVEYLHCRWQNFIAHHANTPQSRASHSYRTDPTNRALQSDLLILLKGDVRTAKRLLLQQRRRHPGKSDNWYLEKVIYDLERDRH
ncbi:hypothetical protein H6G93_34410 [Nostoc sp. FACHB-973]|nr:hypothetical protein [Nostoc sp. FACHB-973]